MKRRFSKLVLFTLFIFGIPSCQEDCDCCDLEAVYFAARVVDFDADEVKKQVAPKEWQAYLTGDTINAIGDLSILLRTNFERIVFQKSSGRSVGFVNAAYACTPALNPTTDQGFVSLGITSSADYNENYPAGTDLLDLFTTYTGSCHSGNHEPIALTQYLEMYSQCFILSGTRIYLGSNPSSPSAHTFEFELQLSDTTIHFHSPEIILK